MDNKVIFWDIDGSRSHPNKGFESALYESLLLVVGYADKSYR